MVFMQLLFVACIFVAGLRCSKAQVHNAKMFIDDSSQLRIDNGANDILVANVSILELLTTAKQLNSSLNSLRAQINMLKRTHATQQTASASRHVYNQQSAQRTLIASDQAAGSYFGESLAVMDTVLAVGSFRWRQGAGAVYLFEKTLTGRYIEVQRLNASRRGSLFGFGLAANKDMLVAGAPGANGFVNVYQQDNLSSTLNLQHTLVQPSGAELVQLGRRVAVSSTGIIVAAAAQELNTEIGVVVVYRATAEGAYGTGTVLSRSDGAHADKFGDALAFDGNLMVVGTVKHDSWRGAVFVYNISDSRADQLDKIMLQNAPADQGFGRQVAVHGSTMVISSVPRTSYNAMNSSLHMYRVVNGSVAPVTTVPSPTTDNRFGMQLLLDNTTLVVGSPNEDKVFIYNRFSGDKPPLTWNAGITGGLAGRNNAFGGALAFANGDLVVGAPSQLGGPEEFFTGAAHVIQPVV
eukprot:TRINITY_DN12503_c1_g2_i1.p2 TRINITY_DN12503_c1_g2~~TRINITY_DN12503_c1_g2_i1.p2  ORF type:complete len:465 (+),score=82.70 TRINITY_DN12503_c1_g2_i1:2386-3780(+)